MGRTDSKFSKPHIIIFHFFSSQIILLYIYMKKRNDLFNVEKLERLEINSEMNFSRHELQLKKENEKRKTTTTSTTLKDFSFSSYLVVHSEEHKKERRNFKHIHTHTHTHINITFRILYCHMNL